MLDTSSIADQNFTNSQFDHMEDKFGWMSRNYPTCLMLPFKKENEGNLQLSGAAGLYFALWHQIAKHEKEHSCAQRHFKIISGH